MGTNLAPRYPKEEIGGHEDDGKQLQHAFAEESGKTQKKALRLREKVRERGQKILSFRTSEGNWGRSKKNSYRDVGHFFGVRTKSTGEAKQATPEERRGGKGMPVFNKEGK